MLSLLKDILKSISLIGIIARNKMPISFLRWDTIDKNIRKFLQAFCLLKEISI